MKINFKDIFELSRFILHFLSSSNKKILNELFENLDLVINNIFRHHKDEDRIKENEFFSSLNLEISRIWKLDILKNNWRIKTKMIEFIPSYFLQESSSLIKIQQCGNILLMNF